MGPCECTVADCNIFSKVGIDVILLKGEMYSLGFKKHFCTLSISLFDDEMVVVIAVTSVIIDAGSICSLFFSFSFSRGRAGFVIIE